MLLLLVMTVTSVSGRLSRRMGVLRGKDSIHVFKKNSVTKSNDEGKEESDDEAPEDEVIGTSTSKDNEEIMPLSVVIPDNYNTERLPKPPKGPVKVQLRVVLEHIYGVDQLQRSISVGVRTFCMWKDKRLQYNPEKLGMDMNYFQVSPDNIWTPRVEILNVMESETVYQSAQVYPDGSVFLTTRMMSVVTVKFAAQWFPFDRQNFVFEFAELGHSKDLVYLDTKSQDWEPAFDSGSKKTLEKLNNLEKKASGSQSDDDTTSDSDSVEVLQQSNFILGVAIVEDTQGDAYWVVDNFTGHQGLRFGEGARYYYVGVSTLLEMHRGRFHFILVYILPLVFIITVSQANWFFDIRELDPRLTIASGLLLCMVAFQYTIEQELPKVSYPLWINYYMVGCYVMIVLQCALMVIISRVAGFKLEPMTSLQNKKEYDECFKESKDREIRANHLNSICAVMYPSLFLIFNIFMFGLVFAYT